MCLSLIVCGCGDTLSRPYGSPDLSTSTAQNRPMIPLVEIVGDFSDPNVLNGKWTAASGCSWSRVAANNHMQVIPGTELHCRLKKDHQTDLQDDTAALLTFRGGPASLTDNVAVEIEYDTQSGEKKTVKPLVDNDVKKSAQMIFPLAGALKNKITLSIHVEFSKPMGESWSVGDIALYSESPAKP